MCGLDQESKFEYQLSEDYIKKEPVGLASSVYSKVAEFLLEMHITHLAEIVLSKEILAKGVTPLVLICSGQLYLHKKDFVEAEKQIKDLIAIDSTIAPAWTTLGEIYYTQQAYREAVVAYEKVLKLSGMWSELSY